jgi:MinD superfamily P-loop ATPase
MKELVVISGKGGTGKTSIVASFAALANNKVLVDCDVDAADLHLVLSPRILHREQFVGGKEARIESEKCAACGKCADACQFDAIHLDGCANESVQKTYRVDPVRCEGCGVCVRVCPMEAIEFEDAVSGDWFISDTRLGPLVHARLGVASENTGKLVSLVRKQARTLAEERGYDLIVADGSPGIGCSVIASLAGSTLVLVVTEPTLSGLHDLERVCDLTQHFGAKTAVCVNKYDLNPEVTATITRRAAANDIPVLGTISYDEAVTRAQIEGLSVVETEDRLVADEMRELWQRVMAEM